MELTPWQRFRTRAFLFGIGIKRRMTLGVRVLLIRGNEVYLIRHTYLPGWTFPGGGVEPAETVEESAARETLEETGLRVVGPMELFGIYHNTSPVTNRDHVALYLAREFEQVFEFKRNAEIADFGWFDRHALPDDMTESARRRIAEVFEGVPKDPVWGKRG